MRIAATMVMAALATAGCSQEGNRQAEMANSGLTVTGNRVQATGLPGVSADPSAAVNGCVTAEEQRRPPESYPPAERAEKLGCINAAVAAQINQQLPAKVDALTTLTRVDSAGMTLTYHYKVDVDGGAIPAGQIDQVKAATRSTACGNPMMRQTLALGGSYSYRWNDRNDRELGTLTIDRC